MENGPRGQDVATKYLQRGPRVSTSPLPLMALFFGPVGRKRPHPAGRESLHAGMILSILRSYLLIIKTKSH